MADEETPLRDRLGRFLPGRNRSAEGESEDSASASTASESESTASESQSVSAERAAGRRETASESGSKPEMPPASETTAPSIGPHTVIETESSEDRLARHEQSSVDAMGLDKRRAVVGGSYSPSLARQATIYGIFLAVLAALVIGFLVLANKLDQPPETNADVAPWAQEDARQIPPAPIDFPNYGRPGSDKAPGPEL